MQVYLYYSIPIHTLTHAIMKEYEMNKIKKTKSHLSIILLSSQLTKPPTHPTINSSYYTNHGDDITESNKRQFIFFLVLLFFGNNNTRMGIERWNIKKYSWVFLLHKSYTMLLPHHTYNPMMSFFIFFKIER